MHVQINEASYYKKGSHLLMSYKNAQIPINPVTGEAVIVAEIQCTADMQGCGMFEYNKCAELIQYQY